MEIGNVFISHKHKDKRIAQVVAEFIRDVSVGRVKVYLSSDPRFNGPRAGGNLDEELRTAIGKSGVMILIYTGLSDQQDWSYCMYECGFACSQGIRLLVFQCGSEAPAPFIDKVRTIAQDKSDVEKFTKDFMTSNDFFPDQKEKVTAYQSNGPAVTAKALILHQLLTETIEMLLKQQPEEWRPWPYLRIELNNPDVDMATEASLDDKLKAIKDGLIDNAIVKESKYADSIFGIGINPGQKFQGLIQGWQSTFPNKSFEWLDSICVQIEASIRRQLKSMQETRICQAKSNSSLIPVVTRKLTYPHNNALEFDIDFYDIRPLSPKVSEKMVQKSDMYVLSLESNSTLDLLLQEEFDKMTDKKIYRLPILDKDGKIEYMVHRSLISEFLLKRLRDFAKKTTVQDLLDVPNIKETLLTVAFVSPDETLEDARKKMNELPGCRDVFVTTNSEKDGKIIGMLTNTDLEQLQ